MSNEMTKSAAKREARRKEVKASKNKVKLEKLIGTLIGILIAAIFVVAIGMGIWYSVDVTTSSSEYSLCLNEDGTIKGADLTKVTSIDFNSVTVPMSEVEYTDDSVSSDVSTMLTGYSYYDTETDKAVEDGDDVNIDYTGYIDGVAFENGSTNGNGQNISVGTKMLIDNFEDQLIGHKINDEFQVTVTFPEEYENDPSKAGKEATFDVKINSIRVTPEFTDEFVAEHLSDKASTAEGYRAFLKNEGYKENLRNYLEKYVADNASAKSVPSAYIKNLRSLQKYTDEQMYQYYNSFYSAYMGYTPYNKLSDYTGAEGHDYEVVLKNAAKKTAAATLTYELTFKSCGLSVSDADYQKMTEQYPEETYGKGFVMQQAMREKVLEYAMGLVKVQ
ncbi:MAG: FKBP-type peptidyl-prolyl cis-trans isomerase [Lachnospiraceae bacterium]|nr:FKBP-type peptidyl-prolyl cis-trans isomerase [Lachnospiraceae bacterium]